MNAGVRIVAFADRDGRSVFVKVPGEYGRYVRTSVAVTVAACHCGAQVGEPCVGQYGRRTGSVHADRLVTAGRLFHDMGLRGDRIIRDDVLEEEETTTEPDKIDLRGLFR